MLRSRTMLRGTHPVSLRQQRFAQRRRERWLAIGPGVDERPVELRRGTIRFVDGPAHGAAPFAAHRRR